MGIGKPEHKGEVTSYVLGKFTLEQEKYLKIWIDKTCDALIYLLDHTMQETSSLFTQKAQPQLEE